MPQQQGWLAFDWSDAQARALAYINQGTLYHRFESHSFMNCSPPLWTEYRLAGTVLSHYPGPRHQARTVDRFRVVSAVLLEVQYAPSEAPVQFGYELEWREGHCCIAVPQFYQHRDVYAFGPASYALRHTARPRLRRTHRLAQSARVSRCLSGPRRAAGSRHRSRGGVLAAIDHVPDHVPVTCK